MPRFEASWRASRTLPSEEYGPGMATPVTFSFPTAATAMQATTEESMPPLSPTSVFWNPHLRT